MIEPDQIMPELKLEFRILDVSDFCARQKKIKPSFYHDKADCSHF